LLPNSKQANNRFNDNSFKSDILHSILNFKGLFKNNEKNILENIYQSQDCVKQLNQLNGKLEKLKIPAKSNLEKDSTKCNNKLDGDEDCIVKIEDSPLKPEISNKNIGIEKQKVLNNNQNKRINDLQNPKKIEHDNREYYYFHTENSLTKEKLDNEDKQLDIFASKNELVKKENYLANKVKKNNEELIKKCREENKTDDNHLEKSEKTNIINEIHFNSDVRMKRYEILLEFINSNMKEIGKMVSGEAESEIKISKELYKIKKCNENEKNGILNHKLIKQNNIDSGHKRNFSKNDDFTDPRNIYYTSYFNSIKKIEETNSNKVSSLHSKINLNSRISLNEFNIDNSEIKESNIVVEEAVKHPNLIESNFTNHFKEQINNISLLLNLQNKENNFKYNNLNNIDYKYQNEVTNEFESIDYFKSKKDPGSSLLLSSIYSDFNPDLIDESFNKNILNLISNPNQHSKVYTNAFFTTSTSNIIKGTMNQNEHFVRKESSKFNKDTDNINELNENREIKKLDSKTNIVNLNTNNHKQNQIINNIITMNNNYNRSKQQLAVVNDSKNNVNQANDKSTIPLTKSKTELTNAYLNQKKNSDASKSKNNLDKNLLTLITNSNDKMLNQNITNPNPNNLIKKINYFPRSEITKTNNLNDLKIFEARENCEEFYFKEREKNINKNTNVILSREESFKSLNFENKDLSEMIVEKEININLIKNIDNNFNNINAINNKSCKINQINEDQMNVIKGVKNNNNTNNNFIKLDNKINSNMNKITQDRNIQKADNKTIKQQMSPTNDSDRTVVQYYEKNVNPDNLKMNYLLKKNDKFNSDLKGFNTDNLISNLNIPNGFK